MFDIGARFLILFGLIVLLVLGLAFQGAETQIADSSLVVQVESENLDENAVAETTRGVKNDFDHAVQQNIQNWGKENNFAF